MALLDDILKRIRQPQGHNNRQPGLIQQFTAPFVQQARKAVAPMVQNIQQNKPVFQSQQSRHTNAPRGASLVKDYFQGQVVQPMQQGIESFKKPDNVSKLLGGVQMVGGAFSATPQGMGFNTITGILTGAARAIKEKKPVDPLIRSHITKPTSIATDVLDIGKTPINVAGTDISPVVALGTDLALSRNPKAIIKDPTGIKSLKNIFNKGKAITAKQGIYRSPHQDDIKMLDTAADILQSKNPQPLQVTQARLDLNALLKTYIRERMPKKEYEALLKSPTTKQIAVVQDFFRNADKPTPRIETGTYQMGFAGKGQAKASPNILWRSETDNASHLGTSQRSKGGMTSFTNSEAHAKEYGNAKPFILDPNAKIADIRQLRPETDGGIIPLSVWRKIEAEGKGARGQEMANFLKAKGYHGYSFNNGDAIETVLTDRNYAKPHVATDINVGAKPDAQAGISDAPIGIGNINKSALDDGVAPGGAGSIAPRKPQNAPEDVVNEIRAAIQANDIDAAKELHKSFSVDFTLPKFTSLVDEVETATKQAFAGADEAVDTMKYGNYKDIANKMKNFLRLQGESKKNGTLYREHIPERIFGVSSDEVAASLGKSETEFMNELTKDLTMLGAGNDSPQVVARFQNKLKQLNTIYDKLDPKFYKVLKSWDDKGRFVSAEATPKTLDKVFKNNQKAQERAAKLEYQEWRKAVASQEAPRTGNQAIKDATGSIKVNTNSPLSKNPEELKDIGNLASGWRDVYRNFKAVYGKRFEDVKRIVLDPFDASKGRLVREKEVLANELDDVIVKGLGIKKQSKESAAVQLFGEGKKTYEELVDEFGPQKADNIVQADKWFRAKYDSMLDEVNAVRKIIYPNNPDKLIPKRKDYYRHFREMADGFQGLVNIFENPAGISAAMSGPSAFSKPKSKWASFMQKRLGDQSDIDAVGGFLNYADASLYAKHIDPNIPNFRALREELVQATSEGENAGKLNNFIEYLDDFANDLAGKTNPSDRAIQKYIPGGRKTFQVLNWVNSRVKANTIVGNVGSTVAQIFNVPQGIANAGYDNAVKGLGRSLAKIFKDDNPINQSTFINERYSRAFDRFDTGMLNNTKKFASWMTGVLDEVGTKFIWESHYAKALADKVDDPVKYADDITRNLVAGRGIGEVPLVQKAKVTQMLAPFQLEVGNLWWVMKDFVDEKAFGKITTLFVMNYLFNRAAEQLRGSAVTFDPIQAMIDAFGELDEENGAVKAGGRLAGEFLSNIPGGQSVAALYPEYGFKAGGFEAPTREELFGRADPTRFGEGLLAGKAIQDPLFKVLLPYGGNQLKKTLEGIFAADQGYSETGNILDQILNNDGEVRYGIDDNLKNRVQTALFGQYSTPEAREFFKENRSNLSEKQSAHYRSLDEEGRKKFIEELYKSRELEKMSNEIDEAIKKGEDPKSLIEQMTKEAGATEENAPKSQYEIEFADKAARAEVKATGKAVYKNGKVYYKADNGDTTTIDLNPPKENKKQGIAAFEEKDESMNKARKIWAIPDSQISQKSKESAYKKLGVEKEDVRYDYISNFDNDVKTKYILSKNMDHDTLIERLMTGRVQSASGKYFASDGVLDELYKQGKISSAERKALKAMKFNKDGTPMAGSGKSGGKGGSGKARAKAIANFYKEYFMDLSKLSLQQVRNDKQSNVRNLEKILAKRRPENTGLTSIQSILAQSEAQVKKNRPLSAILSGKQA